MKFGENFKVVLAASALDLNVGATQVTDSINMKGFHHCTYLIDVGTMGVANSTVVVYSGATAATLTSALTFRYAYGGATALFANYAAGHDVLAAQTEAATLAIVQGTYPNYMLQIEVDGSDMDVANGEEWLTMEFTDAGGATGLVSVFAILEPRYTGNLSLTALT